jgi:pantoate--beta-alanine ligase
MRTVRTVAELRSRLAPERRAGRSIGLVPTMGYYHDGHLSLMRRARAENDVVVVSLFVNPAQFGPGEDFEAYPRDEDRDLRLAAAEGVDLLFAPPLEEVYPDGFATTVSVGDLTDTLEGDVAQRGPEHFEGVTTVVTKLFNMVGPDVAYFGQKDAQQAAVVKQVVKDLNVGVEIHLVPTVRDADGLALSSRNAYLSEAERRAALTLPRALLAGEEAHRSGRDAVAAARAVLDSEPAINPDYVELARFNGALYLLGAARVGRTRLIDNIVLEGALQ